MIYGWESIKYILVFDACLFQCCVLDILIRSLPPYRCILSASVFCGALESTFVRDHETPINQRSSNFPYQLQIVAIVCGDQ